MTPRITLIALLLLLAGTACGSGGRQGTADYRDRNVITHEELNERAYNDAYHAVESLRSHWLRTRGVDSINRQDQVSVIMNNVRLGDPSALRNISTREIVYIRFYDAASASARWGRDVRHGVIFISTQRS